MALSNRDHALLWVLAALLVSAGAWFGWLTPTSAAIQQATGRVRQLDQEKQLLTNRLTLLAATERDLAAHPDSRRLVELAAPTDGDTDELVATFEAMATSSGLTLTSLQPQQAADRTDQRYLGVNVTGTFSAIQAFTKAMESNVRPLSVQNLSLANASAFDGSTLLSATFTVGALRATIAPPSGGTP